MTFDITKSWTLKRDDYRTDGIFGILTDDHGPNTFCVLEHAFIVDGKPVAKVAPGIYDVILCDATKHVPYPAYELQGVPPFQGNPVDGIKQHIGNYNEDSDGCQLLGLAVQEVGSLKMVVKSKAAYDEFMKANAGVTKYRLTILA